MFNSKRVTIGLPLALLAAAAVMALALYAFAFNGGAGIKDGVGIKGIIEWTVYDSAGNIKEQKLVHNTDTLLGHTAAADRLFLEATNIDAGGNDAFAAIQLNSVAGAAAAGTKLTTVGTNPLNDTSVTCSDSGGTVRRCVIDAAFTATEGAAIVEIQLVKGADGAAAAAAASIFAYQGVTITLASADSVTFTWTVNLD
ncbi:MAG: hypothetical protein Q8O76_10170 [Chloroflexota bacterium]|nr:hypothetical protein [Chloroflexota bacterium]